MRKEFIKEAKEILSKSGELKKTADWQFEQVKKFIKDTASKKVEMMGWEEKERVAVLGNELMGRMNHTMKELFVLEDAYMDLRKRIEKVYGKSILPPLGKSAREIIGEIMEGEDGGEDSEDWWKKCK